MGTISNSLSVLTLQSSSFEPTVSLIVFKLLLPIVASLCWLVSGICGVVSTWKLAKRERYLLKHGETYRNETPKLIIGAFIFALAALISASFIPDPPDQEQISVKEETAEENLD